MARFRLLFHTVADFSLFCIINLLVFLLLYQAFTMVQSTTNRELQDLRELLENLPDALPAPLVNNSEYLLTSFTLDPATVSRMKGDVPSAVCETFRALFVEDGKIYLDERGESICAVTDVLAKYLVAYPEHQGLLKWVKQLKEAAQEVYKNYGKEVRHLGLPL